MPATDSYIEKEAIINEEIDRMRLSATRSLFERRDVIIVASVSCIYGLGSPEAYYGLMVPLERGQALDRDELLRKLVEIQYERNDVDFARGAFRVRGDIVELYPTYDDVGLRVSFFGDEIDELVSFDHADRPDRAAARTHLDLSEVALRRAARAHEAGDGEHQGGARRSGWPTSRARGACWKRSACTSARCSTSR